MRKIESIYLLLSQDLILFEYKKPTERSFPSKCLASIEPLPLLLNKIEVRGVIFFAKPIPFRGPYPAGLS